MMKRWEACWAGLLTLATVLVAWGLSTTAHPRIALADPSPQLVDTDGDGIPDVLETPYNRLSSTRADTDGDGFLDGFEVCGGSNPNDGGSKPEGSSGTQVLCATDGSKVYLGFVFASKRQFSDVLRARIVVAKNLAPKPVIVKLDVTPQLLSRTSVVVSRDGMVLTLVLTVSRAQVDLWSLGSSMRDSVGHSGNGLVINQRSDDVIYSFELPDEDVPAPSRLEPVEPSGDRGGNPNASSFLECQQQAIGPSGSGFRFITSEQCVSNDLFECVADCGALTGTIVVDTRAFEIP